jgi:hypothetical protein
LLFVYKCCSSLHSHLAVQLVEHALLLHVRHVCGVALPTTVRIDPFLKLPLP